MNTANEPQKANSNSNRLLLIVAYYFPPLKSMSSFRNYCIAKYLSDSFDQVSAFTTSNSRRLPNYESIEYLKKVNVELLPTLDYRTFSNSADTSGVTNNHSALKAVARRIKESFPFNLFIGLGGLIYVCAGIYKGSRLLRSHKNAVVFSSFKPYADHMIAYVLKCRYPEIKWVADFNNLHIEPNGNNLVFPRFQRFVNKQLIRKANLITTVSEGLVPHLVSYAEDIFILENGFIDDGCLRRAEFSEKFTISYTGSLYSAQSFRILATCLDEIFKSGKINRNQIELRYAGTSRNLWSSRVKEYMLDDVATSFGNISLTEAYAMQQSSCVNLLLTWTLDGLETIVPGKFYDYLKSKRPLLVIINGQSDPGWEMRYNDLRFGCLVYDKPSEHNSLKVYLEKEIDHWLINNRNNRVVDIKNLSKFTWSNLASQLSARIDEL